MRQHLCADPGGVMEKWAEFGLRFRQSEGVLARLRAKLARLTAMSSRRRVP